MREGLALHRGQFDCGPSNHPTRSGSQESSAIRRSSATELAHCGRRGPPPQHSPRVPGLLHLGRVGAEEQRSKLIRSSAASALGATELCETLRSRPLRQSTSMRSDSASCRMALMPGCVMGSFSKP